MTEEHILPTDTQAILLLCGYFSKKAESVVKPLTLAEYNNLAGRLRKAGLRPEDLLHREGQERIAEFSFDNVGPERLTALLERGVEMGFAVEEWARQGIWVVSRGEASYPNRLKSRLRESAPALLFGVGHKGLLDCIGLGIVGSRKADEAALGLTREVARRCGEEGVVVISGGAKGVDDEAMHAALEADGSVIGVLPEGVARPAVSKTYRKHIERQHLVLLSPYHPHARWTTGNAMGRNKHVYAFSDWTLVVSSETDGGTWSGACENLKNRWVPLLVRADYSAPKGNQKLIQLGGIPFSAGLLASEVPLRQQLDSLVEATSLGDGAPTLFSSLQASPDSPNSAEQSPGISHKESQGGDTDPLVEQSKQGDETELTDKEVIREPNAPYGGSTQVAAEAHVGDLFPIIWPSLSLAFTVERADEDLTAVAKSFNIQPGQLRAWLKQAVDADVLEKQTRPVRYVLKAKTGQ